MKKTICLLLLLSLLNISFAEEVIDKSVESTLPSLQEINVESTTKQSVDEVNLENTQNTEQNQKQEIVQQSIKVIFALIFIIGFIILLGLLLKKINRKVFMSNDSLRVVQSLDLGVKEKILVLEIAKHQKKIILGVTPYSITKIDDMPAFDELNQDASEVKSFFSPSKFQQEQKEPDFGLNLKKSKKKEGVLRPEFRNGPGLSLDLTKVVAENDESPKKGG